MPLKKLFLISFSLFLISVFPSLVLAHGQSDRWLPYWGPLISCNTQKVLEGGEWKGKYSDPCSSLCDLLHTFQHVIYFGMSLALFVFAPVLFLWGGILILTSGGSEERVTSGRQALKRVAIGVAIVLGSFIIVNTFLRVIVGATLDPRGLTGVAWPNVACSPGDLPGTIAP